MQNSLKSNLGNITQKWVDILTPFSDDYSSQLSASELAKKSNQNNSVRFI